MVTDSISNLIIHLKNSNVAGLPTATITFSKMKLEILKLLEREGYVGKVKEIGKTDVKKTIEVELLYVNKKPAITNVKRVSHFSRRVYIKAKEIVPVKNGYGLLIITTPKGVMTGKDAKAQQLGGEALFNIW